MRQIALLGSLDGIGGLLLTFQCGALLKERGINPKIFISATDIIFEPIKHLYSDQFDIQQVAPDSTEDSEVFQRILERYDEAYFICPNLTFSNKHAFNLEKYNLSIQTVLQKRTLLHKRRDKRKIVLALNSNTAGYSYRDTEDLTNRLSKKIFQSQELRDFKIILPILTTWSDKPIPKIEIEDIDKSEGLIIKENPSMLDSINDLQEASYCICADNGFSHLAYQLGVPRLLLDPRLSPQGFPWHIRWREDMNDSVDISLDSANIANIVYFNLLVPQTQLLRRDTLINNLNATGEMIKQQLLIKSC